MLTEKVPRNIVRALGGRGKKKKAISSKGSSFHQGHESPSENAPEITSDSESECDDQEPLSPLPKLSGAAQYMYRYDELYLDSGCSRHMTWVKQYLHIYSKESGPKVVFGDNSSGDTEGYGSVNCNGITFIRVVYVNGLKHNLISISHLCDANFKVLFTKTQRTIFYQNNEIVLISPRRRDVYVIDMSSFNEESNASFFLKPPAASTCTPGYFALKKSDTSDCITSFIKKMENLNDKKVKELRSDNRTEFRSHKLEEFCDEKGISQNFSSPCTPEQNGTTWESLMKMPRLMDFLWIFFSAKAFSEPSPSFGVIQDTPVPQDRWSREKHIDLVNIIGEPLADVTTRSSEQGLDTGPVPHGGIKRIFKNKMYENGAMIKNKEKLVAQGFKQEEGIDYDETFALEAEEESMIKLLGNVNFDEMYGNALDMSADKSSFDTKLEIKFIGKEVPMTTADSKPLPIVSKHQELNAESDQVMKEAGYDLESMPGDKIKKKFSKTDETAADNVIDELVDMANSQDANLNASVDKPPQSDPLGHHSTEFSSLVATIKNLESSLSQHIADKIEESVPRMVADALDD
ncbi:retrovirus-related pol polyprotein from transposon TNT 1-94 [Tanacetum coccineum]